MNTRFINNPLPANVKAEYDALKDAIGPEFEVHIHPTYPDGPYGCTPCGIAAIRIRNVDAREE